MKVTNKKNYSGQLPLVEMKSVDFYVRAGETLIKEMGNAELCVTGLGDAVSVAASVATELEQKGLATILKIETEYLSGDSGLETGNRSHAQISVVLKAIKGSP